MNFLAAIVTLAAVSVGEVPPVGPDFQPRFQRGVVFAHNHSVERGYGTEMSSQSLEELKKLGVDSVTIVPLGYSFNVEDPRIFGYKGEDLTMTPASVRRTIRFAHAAGLRVTLAPQIWIGMYGARGDWRGDIRMKNRSDWQKWFAAYTEFILFWARMAQDERVELFCVGSEMRTSTELRPRDWRQVIRDVRGVYLGPCTYSANWADEIDFVDFWDLLEYIGISYYFPIGGGTLGERLVEAARARDRVGELARRFDKPVLFLEAGFRSIPGAGLQPHAWREDSLRAVDLEEQRISFEVLFRTFWNQEWFYGFYWWKWFSDLDYRVEPPTDFQFRNKPAAEVLRRFYGQPDPQRSLR